jgi:hypothetical protein
VHTAFVAVHESVVAHRELAETSASLSEFGAKADMPGRVGLACLGQDDPTGPYRIAPIARFLMLIGRVPQYAIGLRLRRTTLVSQTRQRSA